VRDVLPPRSRVVAGTLDLSHRGGSLLQTEMRRIVESIYGPSVRHLPGLDVGRAYWAATKDFRYGGDMVDVFQYGNGATSLAVVDISGHGIRAARYAGLAKYALRAYASRGLDALESVRALNRLCIENSEFEAEYEFFATVFFGIVDANRTTMQYVSAGHEAAYVVASDGGPQMLGATGPIVGLMDDDAAFDQESITLDGGDIFAAVTDGFTEARDEALTFLGATALVDIIERYRTFEAEKQAEAITRYAYEYAGERLQDDVAALVIKVDTQTTP
jgi:sigma-B regulation protein RsbU (phosphoserine phosphatase)